MKSCKNCIGTSCEPMLRECKKCSYTGCLCNGCHEHSNWKPDYKTLESENAELKQELELRDRELELLSEYNESCPGDYGLITCDSSLPERCDVDNSECWLKWALEKARKDLSHD